LIPLFLRLSRPHSLSPQADEILTTSSTRSQSRCVTSPCLKSVVCSCPLTATSPICTPQMECDDVCVSSYLQVGVGDGTRLKFARMLTCLLAWWWLRDSCLCKTCPDLPTISDDGNCPGSLSRCDRSAAVRSDHGTACWNP
jgi:hypothetical protein